MKPGHTVFFKKEGDEFVKAVIGLAVGHDPNEKDHAIDITKMTWIYASNDYKLFNVKQNRNIAKHEQNYMNKNSRLYDRHSE